MRTNQEMREHYVDKSLQDIFKMCHDENDIREDATEKLTEGLQYLKISRRFRQDRRYANSTFGEFLLHEFQIDEKKQFDVWITAYAQFPEEAKEVGPSLVQDIKQKCGPAKVKPVVEEILTKQEDTGERLPLKSNGNHPSIEKIIKPHKRPVPEKPKSTLREDYKDAQRKLAATETALHDTQEELAEKEEQVNKLKKTVIANAPHPVELEVEDDEVKFKFETSPDFIKRIGKEQLLSHFENKIGKIFEREDFEMLKSYISQKHH